jgi:hypothetical protein
MEIRVTIFRATSAGCSLLFALAAALPAHDYWIEPSTFRPKPGEAVLLSHRVGERLAGEAVPRNPLAIVRFDLVSGDGETSPVPGRDGVDPAGFVKVGVAGPALVVFQSTRSFVELLPGKFDEYLALEGLEKIQLQREKLGRGKELGREAFSRSAAAWLCVGGSGASRSPAPAARPAGLDLEIEPDHDLCAARAGQEVGFRVLFRGKPVAGLLAVALSRTGEQLPIAVRTDRQGRFRFKLETPGFWLIKAVEMQPLLGVPNADWESFWASLTFELREGGK